jgi:hypothetical protein
MSLIPQWGKSGISVMNSAGVPEKRKEGYFHPILSLAFFRKFPFRAIDPFGVFSYEIAGGRAPPQPWWKKMFHGNAVGGAEKNRKAQRLNPLHVGKTHLAHGSNGDHGLKAYPGASYARFNPRANMQLKGWRTWSEQDFSLQPCTQYARKGQRRDCGKDV